LNDQFFSSQKPQFKRARNSIAHFVEFAQRVHGCDLRARARYRCQGLEWDKLTVVGYSEVPGMTFECRFCKAVLFAGEPKGICCLTGKVVLPHLREAPEPLSQVLSFTLKPLLKMI
jgi:hypothetical protein